MLYKKIYLVGSGRTAENCLRVLYPYQKNIVYITTEKKSSIFSQRFCEQNNIEFFCMEGKALRDFLFVITEQALIISAHNSYLFPREIVEKQNLKIINMHIALLPFYRGMNAPTWEIFDQQRYAGTTWHEVTAGIDNGGIICQQKFQIEEHDTALKVLLKSFEFGVKMLHENIEKILAGQYQIYIPTEKTRLYLKKDMPNNGYMNLEWDIDKKYAFLRAMDYSGTNIMPFPKLKKEEKEWEIWKYKMEEKNMVDERKGMKETEGIVRFYTNEKKCLSCWLREI